jgi:hypothetical protein
MTRTTNMIGMLTGLALAGASGVAAQTVDPKAYIDVHIAGQTQSVTVASSSAFSLYGEPATTSTSQTVGKGLAFDGGAGYRIWNNVSIGVAVSMFTRSPAAAITITTPDPIVFGAFSTLTASPQLRQRELGTHIKLAYALRLNETFEVAISGGPSFVHLRKDIASASAVTGTPQISVVTQTAMATGGHGGLDATYIFTPRVGASVFARYVAATADLPAASVPVGGFQGGLGVRLRF